MYASGMKCEPNAVAHRLPMQPTIVRIVEFSKGRPIPPCPGGQLGDNRGNLVPRPMAGGSLALFPRKIGGVSLEAARAGGAATA